MLKPLAFEDFIKAVEKTKERLVSRTARVDTIAPGDFIFVKLGVRYITKVVLKDLVRLEANNKYLQLYIRNQRKMTVGTTLGSMEEQLPPGRFIRVHKSHIVNIAHVSGVVANCVLLDNKEVIDIGPATRKWCMRDLGSIATSPSKEWE